jgi:hypothetical protein
MKEISVGKNLVANTKTLMYTVPDNHYAKWNLLYAHNATASAKNFSGWWYNKAANTEVAIVDNYPLPAKEYLKFDGGAYVVLEEGDEIRVQVETGATASCIVTLELVQKNATRLGV